MLRVFFFFFLTASFSGLCILLSETVDKINCYFFVSYQRDHISVCPQNKAVSSQWPWAQTQDLRHILFNRSRHFFFLFFLFYPGESSPESLSEAPQGLKYCRVALKKSCLRALCFKGGVMFALTLNSAPLETECVCVWVSAFTMQQIRMHSMGNYYWWNLCPKKK